jgi:hypothetical protein
MSIRRLLTLATLVAGSLVMCAAPASAQAVKLEFHDGTVTLTTQNAPLRTILAEWARQGGTQMVNVEKITGAPLTLQLTNVPEMQALDIILRGNAGYVLGMRTAAATPSQSTYDRILLVPTAGTASALPSRPAAAPPPFAAQQAVQPPPQPDPDDNPAGDVPPDDDPPNRRGVPPPGRVQPFQPQEPGQPQPPAPSTPANPFGIQPGATPGSARPGTITPVPPAPQRPRSQPDNEP